MDLQDAISGTPEWRPASSIASGMGQSTATSSIFSPFQMPVELPQFDHEPGHRLPFAGRDITPHELTAARTLTDYLRVVVNSNQQMNTETRSQSVASQISLNATFPEAIDLIVETIRYNSKWFTKDDLARLLAVALNHGSESMVTHDLYACISLITTVGTYAMIPMISTFAIARLLAYSYWQGHRTHKHDGLRKAAWHASRSLLQTHLRDQFIQAMLRLIASDYGGETKELFAAVSGALMIIRDKILFSKDGQDRIAVPLPALLDAMEGPASGGSDMQSQVLSTLERILNTHDAEIEMHRLVLWPHYVYLIEKCQGEADDMVEPALDGLTRIQLETPESLRIARIYLQTHRPLPQIWSSRLLQHYCNQEIQDEGNSNDNDETVTLLAQSREHSDVFQELVQKHLAIVLDFGDLVKLKLTMAYYEDKIYADDTTEQAAKACASAITATFRTSLLSNAAQATVIFGSLCQIAKNGPLAARLVALELLLRLRANVRREVFVKGEKSMESTGAFLTSVTPTDLPDVQHFPIDSSKLFDISAYEYTLLDIFNLGDWETFDFVLDRLSDQLANQDFFLPNSRFLEDLRATIAKLIENTESIIPPHESGYSKSQITMRLVHLLTTMIGYHNHFTKKDLFETLGVFLRTTGARDHELSIHCVHALTICCYELPELVTSRMEAIIDKMTKMITQRFVAVHVLEFLAGLCRLPKLYRNFRQDDFKRIFAVCRNYLAHVHSKEESSLSRQKPPSVDSSSIEGLDDSNTHLPTYIYALTHHVMTFWYLAMKPVDRTALRPYITRIVADTAITMDDQGLVILDMMDHVDSEEVNCKIASAEEFGKQDGTFVERYRLAGLTLISTQTSLRTGKSLVQIRRPSGTVQKTIKGGTFVGSTEGDTISLPILDDRDGEMNVYGHINIADPSSRLGSDSVVLLKDSHHTESTAYGSQNTGRLPTIVATIPDADLKRAVESLDRISALDSHKAAVIYIGEGQTSETEILSNVMGSPDYLDFVHGLGEVRKLKGASFNSQGLDRQSDMDGEYVIAWNSNVTELVYHTTTLMPTRPDTDPQCIQKKAHIGNDFVKIFFNNSGKPFDVDTIPSAFNYVNIIITPSARTSFVATRTEALRKKEEQRFYEVQVITREGFPDISSAAHAKIVSGASLPHFVRNLALNACVFSLLWNNSANSGDYPSSWRARLDSIRRLWDRYGKVQG